MVRCYVMVPSPVARLNAALAGRYKLGRAPGHGVRKDLGRFDFLHAPASAPDQSWVRRAHVSHAAH